MGVINGTKENRPFISKSAVVMLIIIAALAVLLLCCIVRETYSFNSLTDVTNTYIELQEETDSLMKASDYLTEQAQCHTVSGEREHMENYLVEAEETRRRETAVEVLGESMPDSKALHGLEDALKESLSLMDREYYAMKLVLLAQGDDDIPEVMKGVIISDEDLSLSPEDKMELARKMLHDDEYYEQKDRIRAHMALCIEELKSATYEEQYSVQSRLRAEMLGLGALVILLLLAVVLFVWVVAGPSAKPEEKKNKGLTLAELLIVVAIIAVLVGIAYPILNKQLEKSREAHDIYTMRQAASAATELYYGEVFDQSSAEAAGFKWWGNMQAETNAAGVYVPETGTFIGKRLSDTTIKPYGKGTKVDGGTKFIMGNKTGAYKADEDYRNALVMVSVFPYASEPYVDVYWKDRGTNTTVGGKGKGVNGKESGNIAKYSLRIYLD